MIHFTPGPWVAVRVRCAQPVCTHVVTDEEGKVLIAETAGGADTALVVASPALLAVCKAYEDWEADLILSDMAWSSSRDGLPRFTERLWDRLLEIQGMRNAAVAKATGGTP